MNTHDETPKPELFRVNTSIEHAVNRGLAIAMLKGVADAAAFMRDEGVPLDVSARVLINPEQRRASDWKRH
jgi:hypothetical protein